MVTGVDEPPPPPPLPPPPLLPHCNLLQSTVRAVSEEHSLEDRWSDLPGMQFIVPLLTTFPPVAVAAQLGGSPVK